MHTVTSIFISWLFLLYFIYIFFDFIFFWLLLDIETFQAFAICVVWQQMLFVVIYLAKLWYYCFISFLIHLVCSLAYALTVLTVILSWTTISFIYTLKTPFLFLACREGGRVFEKTFKMGRSQSESVNITHWQCIKTQKGIAMPNSNNKNIIYQ